MTEQELITKDIAIKLHDALMEHHSFSEAHNLGSYDAALKIIAEAGLGAILLPHRPSARSKQWCMKMAVVGSEPGTYFRVEPWPAPETSQLAGELARVYCSFPIRPMSEYVGELMTCDLARPWWAAPLFFSAVATLLAPGYSELIKRDPPGRAHWGHQVRTAFDQRFKEIWLNGEHEPKPLEPLEPIKPEQTWAISCPVLPWPQEVS